MLPAVHGNNRRLPLSRSYGVNLPSSFSRVVSSTLGYSPRPPVSVYGTGPWHGPSRRPFRPKPSGGPEPGSCAGGICRPSDSHSFSGIHRPPREFPCVAASVVTLIGGSRNVHLVVIGYASRPRLRSRLTPGGLSLPGNPWTYGVRVSSGHRHPPSQACGTLSYRSVARAHDFGDVLSPDHFWRGAA